MASAGLWRMAWGMRVIIRRKRRFHSWNALGRCADERTPPFVRSRCCRRCSGLAVHNLALFAAVHRPVAGIQVAASICNAAKKLARDDASKNRKISSEARVCCLARPKVAHKMHVLVPVEVVISIQITKKPFAIMRVVN